MMNEYDSLAEIYDIWSKCDPACIKVRDFYKKIALGCKGTIVELGVGTGEIALELACNGRKVIGVDSSIEMIGALRKKAKQLGCANEIDCIYSDIVTFKLPVKADLIYFPFRSIGHLLTDEVRIKALTNIKNQCAPGGVFVFDHYIFDEEWARMHEGVPRLMCQGEKFNGEKYYIWDTYIYDYKKQVMNCTITSERVNNGTVIERKHMPLSFSWFSPEHIKKLLLESGFCIKNVYGDFDYTPLENKCPEQIWIVSPK